MSLLDEKLEGRNKHLGALPMNVLPTQVNLLAVHWLRRTSLDLVWQKAGYMINVTILPVACNMWDMIDILS